MYPPILYTQIHNHRKTHTMQPQPNPRQALTGPSSALAGGICSGRKAPPAPWPLASRWVPTQTPVAAPWASQNCSQRPGGEMVGTRDMVHETLAVTGDLLLIKVQFVCCDRTIVARCFDRCNTIMVGKFQTKWLPNAPRLPCEQCM